MGAGVHMVEEHFLARISQKWIVLLRMLLGGLQNLW
jgi:hypothetical protein